MQLVGQIERTHAPLVDLRAGRFIFPLIRQFLHAIHIEQAPYIWVEQIDKEQATGLQVTMNIAQNDQLIGGRRQVHQCIAGAERKGKGFRGQIERAQVGFMQRNAVRITCPLQLFSGHLQ